MVSWPEHLVSSAASVFSASGKHVSCGQGLAKNLGTLSPGIITGKPHSFPIFSSCKQHKHTGLFLAEVYKIWKFQVCGKMLRWDIAQRSECYCYYLVIRSCFAWWWPDRDHGMLTLLEHGRMPRPKEGAELVPVVATWEHATEGEDHKKQQRSSQGKPQRRPRGMLDRHRHGRSRCQIL